MEHVIDEKTPTGGIILEVAVIGAGPAGIIAAKQLVEVCGFSVIKPFDVNRLDEDGKGSKNSQPGIPAASSSVGSRGSIVIFEETSSVGGLWNRDPQRQRQTAPCACRDPGNSDATITVPSSSQTVYEFLNSNLPKDLSSFTDHSFPPHVKFFPSPEEVESYYQSYASLPGLQNAIHFDTLVEKCWKERGEDGDIWNIQVQRTGRDGKKRPVVFQSKRVLVCTGNFRKAFVPDVRGLRHFQGELRHSSAFQTPKHFHEKSVLIVGGGVSGHDIAGVLSRYGTCRRIVVSVRQWKGTQKLLFRKKEKKRGLVIRRGIDHISEDGSIHFKVKSENDGHENDGVVDQICQAEKPDVIIFATGYRYWYPFLPIGNYLTPGGYKMNRLYMRVLHIDDPSLAFIGVTKGNLSTAIMLEYQSKWYAKVVVKEKRAFDRAEMEREAESHDNDGTQDQLILRFPAYCNSLAHFSGERGYWNQLLFLRLPWHVRSLWVRGHPSVYWAMAVIVPSVFLLTGGATLLRSRALKHTN